MHPALDERFGFAERYDGTTAIWRGQNGVRLLYQSARVFGGRDFPEGTIYLIDGGTIAGLDKQLKLDPEN